MRLLLDTNILIALTPRQYPTLSSRIKTAIRDTETTLFASVASLWEIAIKTRIGRLTIGFSPVEFASFVDDAGLDIGQENFRKQRENVELHAVILAVCMRLGKRGRAKVIR